MLVLIGATPEGKKELVGFQTGVRESAQSWRELLIDIKRRGLAPSQQGLSRRGRVLQPSPGRLPQAPRSRQEPRPLPRHQAVPPGQADAK